MYNFKMCMDKISALYQTVHLNYTTQKKKNRPKFKTYVFEYKI